MKFSKHAIFTNMIWRFLERTGAQVVVLIVSIVLARLLSPEDYGTVALVSVFISIMNVFVDSGLGTALVQKKNADN
ncbi:MAG: oligosaccharide flippase family protein, partial [Treponema sp.]|nr:oligosaccharide flippase family protein [Treponema sp.]